MRCCGKRLLAAALALLVAGCVVKLDADGQPCDAQQRCLAGYACVAGKCHRGSLSPDAGPSGPCGACSGQCLPVSHRCVPNDCAHIACPLAQVCIEEGGVPTCLPRPLNVPSHPCHVDIECDVLQGYVCALPSTTLDGGAGDGGGSARGLCTQVCEGPGASDGGCDPGDVCTALTNGRGVAVSLCLPTSQPTPCTSNDACADFGLACVYLGAGQQGVFPVAFCDVPGAGAPAGSTCSQGSECQSGACVFTGIAHQCAEVCGKGGTCPGGESCRIAELGSAPTAHGAVCLAGAPTLCGSCSSACGADGPHCDSASLCNHACDAAEEEPCGAGSACAGGYCQFPDAGCAAASL